MTLAFGIIAAALTITSFVAQVGKIVKTRDTKGLSAATWALSTTAFAVWVVYGIATRDWPLIIPNAICGALAAFILVLIALPHHKRDVVADKLEAAVK